MRAHTDSNFWARKRVLLTGHTGFKGGWLALWLSEMGASVTGLALDPPTSPSFYDVCGVGKFLDSDLRIDIRDAGRLAVAVKEAAPEIVLHLAAQPLVRQSYRDPAETYLTNVIGTVNLFEAIRATASVKAVVNVTTDKCYENKEWVWPYRENEPLGGYDPYSSSKACAELVTASYRQSFLAQNGIAVASARAGNVIGGGDWATDRLVPDVFRAVQSNQTLYIRSPRATRPWQHVLEPLHGYLMLAEALCEKGPEFAEAWNFGPEESDSQSVRWIIEKLISLGLNLHWQQDGAPQPHEANQLMLSSAKARSKLGWHPRWNLTKALDQSLSWHQAWLDGDDMNRVSRTQITEYIPDQSNEKAN